MLQFPTFKRKNGAKKKYATGKSKNTLKCSEEIKVSVPFDKKRCPVGQAQFGANQVISNCGGDISMCLLGLVQYNDIISQCNVNGRINIHYLKWLQLGIGGQVLSETNGNEAKQPTQDKHSYCYSHCTFGALVA